MGRHIDDVDEMKSGLFATNVKQVFAQRQKARNSNDSHALLRKESFCHLSGWERDHGVKRRRVELCSMSARVCWGWSGVAMTLVTCCATSSCHQPTSAGYCPTQPSNCSCTRCWQTAASALEYSFRLEVGRGDSLPLSRRY
jgi:hypothetical protein